MFEQITTEHTHVLFMEEGGNNLPPKFCKSLKEANEDAEKLIKEKPAMICYVFQIRTILKGEINVLRQDFNHASK